MAEQSLTGIKVLEMGTNIAAPYCAKLMADQGAEVIKVELPADGDPARRAGPFPGDRPDPEASGLYLLLNTSKKGITLDFRTDTGADILKKLIARADILVENFEPRILPSLGLGYKDLEKVNPGLVMTSITGFGQTGPYKDYQASEIVIEALGGLLQITGDPDREPHKAGGSQAEYQGGLTAFTGSLTALWQRDETGAGQQVDISLMECIASILEYTTSMYSYMGAIRKRWYSRSITGYPQGIMPCKDGHLIAVLGPSGMESLAIMVERPELELDPLFSTREQRMINWREFDAAVLPWFMAHDRDEIIELAQALRMPFAKLLKIDEVVEDFQYKARDYFVDIDHAATGI
ncbi:MAG: CoA transferase, partial [Dehalococcoidia bacterium]|nr:CoA transferase [Dehalococcoidia bacterium]